MCNLVVTKFLFDSLVGRRFILKIKMNRIKKKISDRVDINNLLDRARKKKEKINKKKLIIFGLFIALIIALGIFLSF